MVRDRSGQLKLVFSRKSSTNNNEDDEAAYRWEGREYITHTNSIGGLADSGDNQYEADP